MPETTVEKVKLTAKEVASLGDEAIKLFISDSWNEIKKKKFPEDMEEQGNRYLACHLAVLNNQNTKSEQIGSLKKEYSGFHSTYTDLKRTVYGQEYARLLKEYTKGNNGISMVVV